MKILAASVRYPDGEVVHFKVGKDEIISIVESQYFLKISSRLGFERKINKKVIPEISYFYENQL